MYKLFSVDDHILEPPSVWSDRVPQRYRDSAPHVIEDETGMQFWAYEDVVAATPGRYAVVGKPPEEWDDDPKRYDQMPLGCYDPKARAADMLSDGILASINFPTLPRFGGALFPSFKDKALADVCVKAWNDFIIDEWCPGGPPGMFVPMAIGQVWDPQLCAEEIRRCAARGHHAFCFPENTEPLGLPSFWTDHWDPVWRACEEVDIPVCMHIGSSGQNFFPQGKDGPYAVTIALGTVTSQLASINLVMSPVFTKFPGLKVVLSEGGIGWVPGALERADRQWERHRFHYKLADVRPSEVFKRNIFLCTEEEPQAMSYRHLIGVDRIMWECDYPHGDSPWPHSQRVVEETLGGLPEDEFDAITHGNAERLFKWQMADPALALAAERQGR
ncbi:MAG: hypothetical protein QOI86_1401 [Actinomycetota bacterium]|jgi:predicted TIM-barrel fold metal-dependent hydrolase|nr:hypothetical protein [Actinomycetota bacterium]